MRGKSWVIALGLVCITGLPGSRWSNASQQSVSSEAKLLIKENPIAKMHLDKDTELVAVSPDDKHFAYVATRGGKELVLVDGVQGKEYDKVRRYRVVFSPDGKRIAYAAKQGGKWLVVVDGAEGKAYDNIGNEDPIFSPDSQHVAYTAFRGERQLVVVDGAEGKEYDGTTIGTPVFSPDGQHVAYGAQRAGKCVLVVDGKERKEVEDIVKGTVVFSPDSRRLAYAARRGKNSLIIVDGKEGKEYRGNEGVEVPVFSPDSQRLAFVSGSGSLVVVDGVEGEKYKPADTPLIAPTFSPDSQHVVFKAIRRGKWVFVLDGVEVAKTQYKPNSLVSFVITKVDEGGLSGRGKISTSLPCWEKASVVFDSPTQFHTYVSKGNDLLRLEAEIVVTGESAGLAQ